MSIKSILVPLNESQRSFNVLETAFVVARRFGAHISAVHAQQNSALSEPFVYSNLTGALKEAVVRETAQASERAVSAVNGQFEAACAASGVRIVDNMFGAKSKTDTEVTASLEVLDGRTVDVLVERARLSDVTAIASPQLGENTIRQTPVGETLESIMLGSGRPVLIVPREWEARRCENAVIGWNESVQAARALATTIPWLKTMQSVTIVLSRARAEGGEMVQGYLSTHGIDANIVILNRGELDTGAALLERCAEVSADFLVVGGYSRARSRQLLFGGVTRHLMKHTNIITVMVH